MVHTAGVGPLPALDRLPPALSPWCRAVERHPDARDPPWVCRVPGLPGLSRSEREPPAPHSDPGLDHRHRRGGGLFLPLVGLFWRRGPDRHPEHDGPCDGRGRDRAASGGGAAFARFPAHGGRAVLSGLCLLRILGRIAGRDPVEGRVVRKGDEPPDADHRRGLWRGPWRVVGFRLPLRSVRRAPQSGGRGELLSAAGLLGARPPARRPGEGGCNRICRDGPDFGFLNRECRDHRDFYHSADEEGGLSRQQGGRGRGVVFDQRGSDPARDGRRGIPDDRVCGDFLHRGRSHGDHPGGDILHRAGLHRASRSTEDGAEGDEPDASGEVHSGRDLHHLHFHRDRGRCPVPLRTDRAGLQRGLRAGFDVGHPCGRWRWPMWPPCGSPRRGRTWR